MYDNERDDKFAGYRAKPYARDSGGSGGDPYFSEPNENGVRYYQSAGQGVKINQKGKNHSLRNGLIIFACIIAGIAILGAACSNMVLSGNGATNLPSDDYIATVYVEGTIGRSNVDSWGIPYGYQHDWVLNEIDRLIYDGNNRGMILYVDSPGGGVYESDELYYKIKEYSETTGNPVYAAMGSMAASGGYYVSAPADKIFANRNCWTGSIGVTIGTIVDVSGLLENYGIKTITIDSGENKSMGSYFDPMTAEQQAIFQSLVDEAYEQFTGIVAEERGMDIAEVKRIADGRIYTAKQALDAGLIDEIGNYNDAIADMAEQYGLYDCLLIDIRYINDSFLMNLLGIGGRTPATAESGGDAAAVLKLLENRNEFPVSYMCEALAN